MKNIIDNAVNAVKDHAVTALRTALAIVFAWFGLLKIFGVSPVVDLIRNTYFFMPYPTFVIVLGFWELAIGLGFLFNIWYRVTFIFFLLQMTGTFFALVLLPSLFFQGNNPLLLTTEGEFVIKNIVLVSAGLVIAAHEHERLMRLNG